MEFTGLGAVFGVIAIVTSGISTLLFGSLKALRDANTDLRARVGDLEDKNRQMVAEVVMLKSDRDALARVVRGDDRLEELVSKQDLHHRESTEHWKVEEALLRTLVEKIGGSS